MNARSILLCLPALIAFMATLECANPANDDSPAVSVMVNEFMVRNSPGTGIIDSDSVAGDWVEIYNAGATSVQLGNYFITDTPERPRRFRFEDTLLPPGGYYVVWGGDSPTSPRNHLGFNFSASVSKDEKIVLYDHSAEMVDSIAFARIGEARKEDVAYGRLPDGAMRWTALENATPGGPNVR